MNSKTLFLLLLAAAPSAVHDCRPRPIDPALAAQLETISRTTGRACPALPNVGNLCFAVSEKLSQRDPALKTRYAYQNMIYQAACVEPEDSPERIRGKVQHFWNTHHAALTCNQLGFSVRNGHLLVLAVERNAEDFVEEAVWDWQLDLNHIGNDGRTVLDYVRDEQQREEGTTRARILKRYRDLLRDEGGARHASELAPGS
jgi:hypothetical protein